MYITISANTVTAELRPVMKVKSKGRKNSKKGTKPDLFGSRMFARVEPDYNFKLVTGTISNERCNHAKYGQSGINFAMSKKYDVLDGGVIKHKKVFAPNKQVAKISSFAFLNEDMAENIHALLTNILLFKGIGFNDIERDVNINGKFTYGVHTKVSISPYEGCHAWEVYTINVPFITVKRTFRRDNSRIDVNRLLMGLPVDRVEICDMMFCSKTVTNVRDAIQGFKFTV